MKKTVLTAAIWLICTIISTAQDYSIPFENGTLVVAPLQDNAVRIRYIEEEVMDLDELKALINQIEMNRKK